MVEQGDVVFEDEAFEDNPRDVLVIGICNEGLDDGIVLVDFAQHYVEGLDVAETTVQSVSSKGFCEVLEVEDEEVGFPALVVADDGEGSVVEIEG
jgi:hypothetical protein